jgi:hypothetical protein
VREEDLTLYRTRQDGSAGAVGSTKKVLGTVVVCVSYLSVYLCPATYMKQRVAAVWTVAENNE